MTWDKIEREIDKQEQERLKALKENAKKFLHPRIIFFGDYGIKLKRDKNV